MLSENVQKQRLCLIYLVLYELLILNSAFLVAFFLPNWRLGVLYSEYLVAFFFDELAITRYSKMFNYCSSMGLKFVFRWNDFLENRKLNL